MVYESVLLWWTYACEKGELIKYKVPRWNLTRGPRKGFSSVELDADLGAASEYFGAGKLSECRLFLLKERGLTWVSSKL